MKFDFFFILLEISLKNLFKIQQLALFLLKFNRYITTATKWAIINFLTRLLQKIINKHFSWISTFPSLSWKFLWKISRKSNNLMENSLKILYKIQNWYLFLHRPKRYIIVATKWAILDFLTRLLQKVTTKVFHEVRLFLHSLGKFSKNFV